LKTSNDWKLLANRHDSAVGIDAHARARFYLGFSLHVAFLSSRFERMFRRRNNDRPNRIDCVSVANLFATIVPTIFASAAQRFVP